MQIEGKWTKGVLKLRVAILGCGVMGSAFARQFTKSGHSLILSDRNAARLKALSEELDADMVHSVREAATSADIVVLAIKPKDLKELSHSIGKLEGQIILSILAGTSLSELKKLFPGCDVVRSMPNLALIVGEAVIALVKDPELPRDVIEKINHLLAHLGRVFWTGEEAIEPITALAGSGPAFIIAILEAIVESGVMMGIRADEALVLALQTMRGTIALLESQKGHHPGEVRWQIAAPGGTTIAGLKALEEANVRYGVMKTFLASYKRAKEMG